MTEPDPGGPKTYRTDLDPVLQHCQQCQLAVVVICSACRRFLQKAAKKQVEGGWILLNIFPIKQVSYWTTVAVVKFGNECSNISG
jgi:hypothetical protein